MSSTFAFVQCKSVEDVCRYLQKHGQNARIMAGGTDLLVGLRKDTIDVELVIGISRLETLKAITPLRKGGLRIGAAATMSQIAANAAISQDYRALAEAAMTVGSVQIRNRATLAGNICNASPAADTVPPLLIFDACLNLVSLKGRRRLRIEEFLVGPGTTNLRRGEMVESIDLPPFEPSGSSCYLKLGRTRGVDLSLVGVAICLTGRKEVRAAFASVGPTVIRVYEIEEVLSGNAWTEEVLKQAVEAIERRINPISDVRSSSDYRRAMAGALFRRALLTASARLENSV